MDSAAIIESSIFAEIIEREVQLMERSNLLIYRLMSGDSEHKYKHAGTLGKPPDRFIEDTSEKFPVYQCLADDCDEIFIGQPMSCGAANETTDNNPNDLCPSCKSRLKYKDKSYKAKNMQKIQCMTAMWSSTTNEIKQEEEFNSLCDTDSNASLQSCELEVMESIYPNEIDIIIPAPLKAGDQCACFSLRIPSLTTYSKNCHCLERNSSPDNKIDHVCNIERKMSRVTSQVRLVFHMPTGYPETASLIVKLQIGNLSMSEFDTNMKRSLLEKLQQAIQSAIGEPSAFSCMQAATDWLNSLRDYYLIARKKDQESHAKLKLQHLRQHEARALSIILNTYKTYARQCGRCGLGPVVVDRECKDLAAFHGHRLNNRNRIDNSCPRCSWFVLTWDLWPKWNGQPSSENWKDPEESLWSTSDTMRTPEQELARKEYLRKQERVNTMCLVASLRSHAKQCAKCGYGPVMKEYCDILTSHHGEERNGVRINNSCPACGWLAQFWSDWKPWNGKLWTLEDNRKQKKANECKGDEEVSIMSGGDRETQTEETIALVEAVALVAVPEVITILDDRKDLFTERGEEEEEEEKEKSLTSSIEETGKS